MKRTLIVLGAVAALSGMILIGLVTGGGTALGQADGLEEVHFTGEVITIGEDPGPLEWWNVEVKVVLVGPSELGTTVETVDVYGPPTMPNCFGMIEPPHDSSAIGRDVDVLGWYDPPYAVEVCDDSHYMRYATPAPSPTPEPTVGPGAQETVNLVEGCNFVTTTYPDGTPPATLADAVSPQDALVGLWAQQPAPLWRGYNPLFPDVSDMAPLERLGVVAICTSGEGTFSRPEI